MPILLLDIFRAVRALRRDPGFVVLSALTLIVISGGGAFYWRVEGVGPLDAFYLSVMTLTTVGYGDVAPATEAGKLFTMGFVVIGMGLLVAFATTIAAHLREHSVLHAPIRRLKPRRQARDTALESAARALPEPAQGFDVLIVGASEAGRRTALEAARQGLRVVVLDGALSEAGRR
jgi:voltage-gated potassium channel